MHIRGFAFLILLRIALCKRRPWDHPRNLITCLNKNLVPTYKYVHAYVHTYIHTHITRIHTHIHIHAYVYACIHTYRQTHTHTHTREYTLTYIDTHTHTHVHTNVNMSVRTHILWLQNLNWLHGVKCLKVQNIHRVEYNLKCYLGFSNVKGLTSKLKYLTEAISITIIAKYYKRVDY
jgi:hypothetical protein